MKINWKVRIKNPLWWVQIAAALVIWLAGLLSFIPCIGWLWGIFCFICAVMGFISAVNGEEKAVPLLGQIRLLK